VVGTNEDWMLTGESAGAPTRKGEVAECKWACQHEQLKAESQRAKAKSLQHQ